MAAGGLAGGDAKSVTEIIDQAPIGGFLLSIISLCALVAMVDGFDSQAMAFVAPAIIEDWGIPQSSFGWIFSSGLVGIMAGQLVFGPLADRYGRRRIIILCTLLFAAFTIGTVTTHDIRSLIAIRFLAGLGLGGCTPNLIALTAEYAPKRRRSLMITLMFAGFPLGAVIGGYLAAKMIPVYGWAAVFWMGGLAPLLVTPFLWVAMPESVGFLAAKGGRDREVKLVLDRLWPGRPSAVEQRYAAPEKTLGSSNIGELFKGGLGRTTLLLWLTFFMSLLLAYVLSSWLPLLLRQSGLSANAAILSAVILNLGGGVGGILLGAASDRFSPIVTLTSAYLVASVAICCLGIFGGGGTLLSLAVFVAGFCTVGAQTALNAAAAGAYPLQIRATGLGWALGVGRIGSIIGPVATGMLVSSHWSQQALFAVSAVPAVVAALALSALGWVRRSDGGGTGRGKYRESFQT